MAPWPNKFESYGHADEPLSTLDAILVACCAIILILVFVNAIAVGQIQERSEKRAEKIEKQYHLERGTPKDEVGDEIMPKGQYWYAWLAVKARGLSQLAPTMNPGDIAISMPSLPLPPYLTDGGKSTVPLSQYTTTQPAGPAITTVIARGILVTGDVDENGHWVEATARCRPCDVDGQHPGIAANTKGAELQSHHSRPWKRPCATSASASSVLPSCRV